MTIVFLKRANLCKLGILIREYELTEIKDLNTEVTEDLFRLRLLKTVRNVHDKQSAGFLVLVIFPCFPREVLGRIRELGRGGRGLDQLRL